MSTINLQSTKAGHLMIQTRTTMYKNAFKMVLECVRNAHPSHFFFHDQNNNKKLLRSFVVLSSTSLDISLY